MFSVGQYVVFRVSALGLVLDSTFNLVLDGVLSDSMLYLVSVHCV